MSKYRYADDKPDWQAVVDDLDAMLVLAREPVNPSTRGMALRTALHHARAMALVIEDEDRGHSG